MPSDNPDPSPQPVATWNQLTNIQTQNPERRGAPIAGTKEETITRANGTSHAEEGGSNPTASITELGDAKKEARRNLKGDKRGPMRGTVGVDQ